jgi:Spy/CpxP family protein refolding chaperone
MQNMKTMRFSMAAALLAACCATSFAAGQAEAPPADRGQASDQGPRGGHGPEDGPQHWFGQMRGHMRFDGHLQLSEAQQDKLFAIHHAAAPQQRQQEKALRHAHEALRALGDAAPFDEARANAAARDLGQAVAAVALLHARVHAQALAVLTPEQREQLHQRRPQPPHERP